MLPFLQKYLQTLVNENITKINEPKCPCFTGKGHQILIISIHWNSSPSSISSNTVLNWNDCASESRIFFYNVIEIIFPPDHFELPEINPQHVCMIQYLQMVSLIPIKFSGFWNSVNYVYVKEMVHLYGYPWEFEHLLSPRLVLKR